MAKKYSFHKGTKKESSCQSGCCSGEVIESVAAPECGCCTEKTETVELMAATSCGCCTDIESLPQAEPQSDEGCNCCASVEGGNMVTNNYAIEGLDS